MSNPRLKSFNYAIGMFGTSIPINMLKNDNAFSFFSNFEKVTIIMAVVEIE